jgi:hypothetical protein
MKYWTISGLSRPYSLMTCWTISWEASMPPAAALAGSPGRLREMKNMRNDIPKMVKVREPVRFRIKLSIE